MLRLKDTFIHHSHLCLVFELLSNNLYELIKQNSFRGLSTSLVRVFTAQLLDALSVLNEAKIIHCDLKPENILLKSSVTSHLLLLRDSADTCRAQTTIADDQGHRLWLGLSREADGLHVHPVSLLPFARGDPLAAVLEHDRHVESRVYLRRALPRVATLPGHERIQPDHAYRRDARVRRSRLGRLMRAPR